MRNRLSKTLTTAVTLLTAVVLHAAPAPTKVEYSSAYHDEEVTYLMTDAGDSLFASRAGKAPIHEINFTREGKPFRWPRSPRTFTRFRGTWIVASGTSELTQFSRTGSYLGQIPTPVPTATIASSANVLWIVNARALSVAKQLWLSGDAKTFTAATVPPAADEPYSSMSRNLLIVVGDGSGGAYTVTIIGKPVLRHIAANSARTEWPLAYSRSRRRSLLEETGSTVDDVTIYSMPVRDIFPKGAAGIVVLRNREDMHAPNGTIVPIQARRVDWYSPTGKHNATATLPDTLRWVVLVTRDSVVGITINGEVLTARWSAAEKGDIIGR